jgi:hypothetical protein
LVGEVVRGGRTQSYANDRGRVRCRYSNQFISRCDDLIESMLGGGRVMHVYWEGPNCVASISRNYRPNLRYHAAAAGTTLPRPASYFAGADKPMVVV